MTSFDYFSPSFNPSSQPTHRNKHLPETPHDTPPESTAPHIHATAACTPVTASSMKMARMMGWDSVGAEPSVSPLSETGPGTRGGMGGGSSASKGEEVREFAPAKAWALGMEREEDKMPLGRGIDGQTKGKKPSEEISPFLFQGDDKFTSSSPLGPLAMKGQDRRQHSLANSMHASSTASRLRNARSAGALRGGSFSQHPSQYGSTNGDEYDYYQNYPSPAKKRGFFGMLKKKASRGDIMTEDSFEESSGGGGGGKGKSRAGSHDQFIDDGSAMPNGSFSGSGGVSKKQRIKKLTSKDKGRQDREGSSSQGLSNNFGLDQDISLDTNLDSMEGIVNLDSLLLQRRPSSTSATSVLTIPGMEVPAPDLARRPTASGRLANADLPPFTDPFNQGRALASMGMRKTSMAFSVETDASYASSRPSQGGRKGSIGGASGSSIVPLISGGGNGLTPFGAKARDFRRGSYISLNSTSSTSVPDGPSVGRRPSLAGAGTTMLQQQPKVIRNQASLTHVGGPGMNSSGLSIGIQAASGSAAWTAPESWAVKPETGTESATDADESEDEDQELENLKTPGPGAVMQVPGLISLDDAAGKCGAVGAGGPGGGLGGSVGLGDRVPGASGRKASEAGLSSGASDGMDHVMSRNGVPSTKRPGAGTRVTPADVAKMWTVRISRSDGSFVTLMSPLLGTTSDIYAQLGKKLYNGNPPNSLQLFMRERGLERAMASTDKPVIIQRRRLEQAGYSDADRLDDVGRADYSYLVKFIFKDESLATTVVDPDEFDSYDYVNLQARSLQAIPIFLFKHANAMIGLNLSHNPKLDMPSDFVALCTHLRELRLCYMSIKRIPQSICGCSSLTYLDVSNNRLVDLEHASLDKLQMLTDLKAHNNRLWTLPSNFASMASLRFLNISNNKFESLPAVICEIEALTDLDISFNMISSLPTHIGNLRNLERLVMLANPISMLPPSFGGLTKLKELDCRRCQLADIAVFSSLPKLEVLHCENNNATILDGSFMALTSLNACGNSITRLLLTGTNSTLKSLNVSHAKISSLGQEFFDALGNCEDLIMDNNQIKSFTDSFAQLTNLRKFSIRNNHLTSLPESIGSLQRLHTLDLANNNLASLPSTIWNCSQLIVLNVTSNLIAEFPMPLAADATTTDETGRKMSAFGKAIGAGRTLPPLSNMLQELFMGDNKLGDNVFSPISLLNELRVLNLSFNELYEIPALTLSKCESLEELYLSGNGLSSLPGEDFERLVNLKTLFLNGNKLQTLPAELGKLKHLESLDVASNTLKYNVTNWPYDWNWNWNHDLQYLNFSGNKRLEIKPATASQDALAAAKRRNLSNFQALRKLRMLGLMDVTLTTPSIPDETEDRRVRVTQSEIGAMGYGIADSLGREDLNVVALDMVIARFRGKDDESIFGMFDAHAKFPFGGSKLAKYLHDSFSGSFSVELRRLRENEDVPEALRRTFLNLNRDYGNSISHLFDTRRKGSDAGNWPVDRAASNPTTDMRCGASAVVVYVVKKTVHVANVGDALAVIAGRGGTARPLSSKHDPFDTKEIERIRGAEGWVSQKGLVADDVEVSRSFGYYHIHPAINARPSVQSVDLTEDDEFIIIANASLWAHMTYQAAVDVTRDVARDAASNGATGEPFVLAAQKLRDLALSYGAESNLMVMVVGCGDLFRAKRQLTYRGAGGALIDEEAYGATRVAARRGQISDAPAEKYLTLLDREVAPPTGMVALVFTDIRNSTSLWESNGGMQSAMRMHNQLLRRQLRAIGGYEVKTEGDAFMVSFPSVTSALLWCFTIQLELLREDWPQDILDSEDGKEIYDSTGQLCYRGLSVRMGIHWGNPHCEADPITRRMDYFGPMVNRSARISGEAKGGEICASLDVIEIVKTLCFTQEDEIDTDPDNDNDPDDGLLDPATRRDVAAIRKMGFGIFEIGERRLKGLESPDFLSLIYPRALAGRLNIYGASLGGPDGKVDEVYDPAPRVLDAAQIRQLAVIVMRLEAVSAASTHAPLAFAPTANPSSPTGYNGATNVRSKPPLHPHLFAYPVRLDASDDELAAILENQIIRLENILASFELRALGPLADVLAALSDAIKLDPRSIMHALEAFGVASSTTAT